MSQSHDCFVCLAMSNGASFPTYVCLSCSQVKATSGETLRVIAERMTLNYVALQAMKHSFEQKSPKVHSESLEWLGQSVKDFGFL